MHDTLTEHCHRSSLPLQMRMDECVASLLFIAGGKCLEYFTNDESLVGFNLKYVLWEDLIVLFLGKTKSSNKT